MNVKRKRCYVRKRTKRTLRYNYYEGVIIPMIRLSYKQQKLVDFINNYRRYVELNPIKEFESKEALDMFIRDNYNKAKVCRARGREMMGYYNNTKSGRLNAEIQRGKATNSGLCSTKQSEWNKILNERVKIKE